MAIVETRRDALAQGRRPRQHRRCRPRDREGAVDRAEVALALVLLTGGGSAAARRSCGCRLLDLGFRPENVLVGTVNPPRAQLRRRAAAHRPSTIRSSSAPRRCRACGPRRSPRCCRSAATATRISRSKGARAPPSPGRCAGDVVPAGRARRTSTRWGCGSCSGRGIRAARGIAVGDRQRDIRAALFRRRGPDRPSRPLRRQQCAVGRDRRRSCRRPRTRRTGRSTQSKPSCPTGRCRSPA